MRRLLPILLLVGLAFGQGSNYPAPASIPTNAQTGTTYTLAVSDYDKLVTFSNGAAVAVTLPQAGTVGLNNGWFVYVSNIGVGTVTITPTTSTIDGSSSLALATNQGAMLVSNGTNYSSLRGVGGTASLAAQAQGTVLAGPSTYGAANAAPTARLLVAADIPAAAIASVDNSIISSAVDASGNPNHIVTAASTAALPINGGTTTLSMFIGGKQMTLNTNVTTTLTTGVNYIYALGDTANANMVAGDFIASLIPLSYSYVAPACSNGANTANGVGGFFAAASASVPHYWFNLSTNQMNICTASGGSFTATSYGGANAPAILIGVAYFDGTSIQAVAPMPFGASPIRISQNFGDGSSGALQITAAGTTTKDGVQQNTGLSIITGTLTNSGFSTNNAGTGSLHLSQNPVIIWNGTVTAAGLGRGAGAAGTGTGSAGNGGGMGGAGGGGGGSGVTSAAGGAGGTRATWLAPGFSSGSGTAGAITPTAGGNGVNAFLVGSVNVIRGYFPFGTGTSGGNGAGDATNNGGQGGSGGGYISISAPSVSITGTGIVKADGNVGGNAAGGNAAAGGGGGGGSAIISAFASYGVTLATNVTAAGGASGSKAGTGQLGGTGGTGIALNIRLQ